MADEPKKGAETPAQAQPPGQFAVDSTHLSTAYANFCRLTGTPEELVLDFGLNTQMTPESNLAKDHHQERTLRVLAWWRRNDGLRFPPAWSTAQEVEEPTEEEYYQAEEEQFLKSPQGRGLTPAQVAARRKFSERSYQSYALFQEMQGKAINNLTIEGLTWQEGNRQITLEAKSKGGGGSMRSQWRRHAMLTVHVPKCKLVTVRGCLRGLDVQGVPTTLIVTSSGYRDRDYNAQFLIKRVRGNLTIADFPANLVEDIDGDVSIETTRDFANSGTQHFEDTRLSFGYRAFECRCSNIRGNLRARVGRMNVHLEDIRGRIDVHNEFGDTTLAIHQPLSATSHRLSSTSGRVEVRADQEALAKLPVLLATNFGTVRTNTLREQFEEFHISTGDGPARDWRGFRRMLGKSEEGPPDIFSVIDVLQGSTNVPGLVVISQAGGVVFELQKGK